MIISRYRPIIRRRSHSEDSIINYRSYPLLLSEYDMQKENVFNIFTLIEIISSDRILLI
jgi:hypothetical protein